MLQTEFVVAPKDMGIFEGCNISGGDSTYTKSTLYRSLWESDM